MREKVIFKFSQYGKYLGSRPFGKTVREKIINLFNQNKFVILDFKDVTSINNAFADECIGKLLNDYSLEEMKEMSNFNNINNFVKRVLFNAIKDHIK